ncbi:histone H1A-like [Xenopus laevis]|uniref:Histone H1A-like n=1 Tax=Xenopus laevis TaxID=8355 RepID=A0A8J1MQJ6_XENLA|nr:histone H1A-like [Xenopus laevis]
MAEAAESAPAPPPAEPAGQEKKQQPKKAAGLPQGPPRRPSSAQLCPSRSSQPCPLPRQRSGVSGSAQEGLWLREGGRGLRCDKNNSRLKLALRLWSRRRPSLQVKGSEPRFFKLNKKQLQSKDKPPPRRRPPLAAPKPRNPATAAKKGAKVSEKAQESLPAAAKARKSSKKPRKGGAAARAPPKKTKLQAQEGHQEPRKKDRRQGPKLCCQKPTKAKAAKAKWSKTKESRPQEERASERANHCPIQNQRLF